MNMNLLMITDNDLAMLRSRQPHEQPQNELDRAAVVSSEAVPPDVVTMNSRVRYVDEMPEASRPALPASIPPPRSAESDFGSMESISGRPLMQPLSSAITRAPVTCSANAPLREGLAAMQRHQVGSVVVLDAEGVPRGIFTERDLVRQTAAAAIDLDGPISGYMTPDPIHLPVTAWLYDAALVMARRGVRRVLVCDANKLVGVVSERSLFPLQRTSMHEVAAAIDGAEAVEDLARAADAIRSLAKNMLAQGVGAEALTGLLATLNERLTGRILALESTRHQLGGIRTCWLGLGSEARREQTFASDQDNAIIFDSEMSADAARARLLPFARAVNLALDACGFPLCEGEIMASSTKWCLSTLEWRARFTGWIRNPGPGALLNATIFFDFRPLWGVASLAHDLRAWLNGMTREDQRFLHMMAKDTVQWAPPLGLFGGFQTGGTGPERGTIDLKKQGTRVFTDAARIYALATGADAQGTADRLRHACTALGGAAHETEAMIQASHFILLLRLRHQHLESRGRGAGDRINPHSLNGFDRNILKEALRQGKKLQSRLALDYQIH